MCKLIIRGVEISPGPRERGPRMNDAQAKNKYSLHYKKLGPWLYEVRIGKYPSWRKIGVVFSPGNCQCWVFSPQIYGVGDRWYIAPTRFEAIDAYCHFLSFGPSPLTGILEHDCFFRDTQP